MDIRIRNATTNDYGSIIKIISQIQDMHVEWRPDIYKYNDNLITKEEFEKLVENNTFFVAENENKKIVGVLEIILRHAVLEGSGKSPCRTGAMSANLNCAMATASAVVLSFVMVKTSLKIVLLPW